MSFPEAAAVDAADNWDQNEKSNGESAEICLPGKEQSSKRSRVGIRKAKASATKFKKAPGAPLRFKSAFIFFSTQKHKEIRNRMGKAGEKEKTTNVAKMVSEAWKNLPRSQREYWEELARKDKERYEIEKSLYRGPWKVPIEKQSKDPNAPKRPMSAFLSYSNSKRSEIKRLHPSKTNAEISRMLAALWKSADDEEKRGFIDRELQQRKAYKEAVIEWKAKAEERREQAQIDNEASHAANPNLGSMFQMLQEGASTSLRHGATYGGITQHPLFGSSNSGGYLVSQDSPLNSGHLFPQSAQARHHLDFPSSDASMSNQPYNIFPSSSIGQGTANDPGMLSSFINFYKAHQQPMMVNSPFQPGTSDGNNVTRDDYVDLFE